MTASPIPAIAALSTHRVDDFDAWKSKFDASAHVRKAAGILGHHVDRGADDPTFVCVFFPATDRGRLEAFFSAPELAERLRSAGVRDAEVTFVVPQEMCTVPGGGFASAVTTHEVADYDRWKAAFDAGAEARRRAGIVGHGIVRSADKPNEVTVYVQSTSAEKLRAMLTGDDLGAMMRKAGVVGTPRVKLLTDAGAWAQY